MDQRPIYARVIETFEENGFNEDAEELYRLVNMLSSADKNAEEASEEIQALCHVRIWGDLNIQTISNSEWGSLLVKLSRYARRKVKK